MADASTITAWRGAGFQYGSLRLLHVSMTAAGSIALRREMRRHLPRPSVPVLIGAADLHFTAPVVDDLGVVTEAVDWAFSLEMA
ncbi:hypothetical protein QNA08_17915 [Chelatococcus sp. SYSU_G07232]|uniref:Uncharacterized protein n=1 Tax=Chelatococcus albus TaxID=3047466 RepID=A0ABT7ANF2_9HYPH|nr:hypothetical protein [Chelatococcus sp. SYSU_G07232]MDJ1160091.1 hypothetical protein [Chelatococcus sp. SYSU_G07232]